MIGEILNSRYQVLEKLSDDGAGAAYVAEDTLGGGPLVLRVVSADPESAQQLRRAFRARAALRHPNLAQAIDTGSIVGTADHFFASERVEGKDLFAASAGWNAPRVADAAAQALRALAYLHGKGVFGVDLRAEAIAVAGDTVKLLDTGLPLAEHEVDGVPVRGAADLASPERLAGAPDDARSDLWALGATLYRVLARRRVYEGNEGRLLFRRVVLEDPLPPSHHVKGIAHALDEFVLALLARDPERRPAGANEAIALLSRLTGTSYEAERDAGKPPAPAPPSPRVDLEVERAKALLETALTAKKREPAPALLVVRGESGSGKSRLVDGLRLAARLAGTTVLEGACRDGASSPLGPFAAILRAAGGSEAASCLAGSDPTATAFRHERGSEIDAILGAPSERERVHLAHRIATLLVDASRRNPLLVIVEDAQWADRAATEAIAHLVRNISMTRDEGDSGRTPHLLVVVATRGGADAFGNVPCVVIPLPAPSPAIERERERLKGLARTERHLLDLLAALRADASADLLARVSGLDADGVADLLDALARRGLVARAGTLWRVARHATREAAYVDLDAKRREALHRAVANGLEATLGAEAEERSSELAEHLDRGGQPERAAEAYARAAQAARRLANAARAAGWLRRAADLAQGRLSPDPSPVGRGAKGEAATAAKGDAPLRARLLESLAEAEVWSGDAASAGRRLDECLKNESLGPADRARLLRKRAEAALESGDLEGAYASASEAHGHLEAIVDAGDRAAVVAVLASALVERGEADAAISGARKMLDALPKGEVGYSLHVALASAWRAKGDKNRAIAELEGCLSWARDRDDGGASLAAVLSSLAELHASSGDAVRGLQCYNEALEAAGKAHDLRTMWRLHVGMVTLHARQGATDLAEVHLAEAERLARRMGSPAALGVVYGSLGAIALEADRPEAALAHFQKAIEVAETTGAAGQRARHLANAGVALSRLARHEEAERAFRDGAEVGAAAKEWPAVVRCHAKLAEMGLAVGLLAEAAQEARRGREVAEREGMPREAARADAILAEVALLSRRADEAIPLAEKAARVWREARVARRLCPALAVLAQAFAETGRLEEALHAADEAFRHLDRVGVRAVRIACLLAKARVLLARAAAIPAERRGEPLSQALSLAREAAQLSAQGGRTWPAQLVLAKVRAAQRDIPGAREHAEKAAHACNEEASHLPPRMAEALLARTDVREAVSLASSLVESAPTTGLGGDDRARFLELLRVARDLTREKDLEKLLRGITDNVVRLFHADRGLLLLLEEGQIRCRVSRTADGQLLEAKDASFDEGIVDNVLRGGAPVLGKDAAGRAVACLPLTVHDRGHGVLYLSAGTPFPEADLEVMSAFASGAAIAVESANLYSQTIVDDFTGLKSHRYFMLRLHEEVRRARRLHRPVALVQVDVDRLKLVNDIHGPEGGNTVIRGVAQILSDLLRQDDTMVVAPKKVGGEKVAGRIEGGKFELLLPDADAVAGATVAERILERVRAITFAMGTTEDAAKAQVTASAGVAAYPSDGETAEGLALKAGEALYTAKRNGRDRVFSYGAGERTPDDAEVKGKIVDPDFDAIALSRDGRAYMGMVSRVLDCGIDLDKILEVALQLMVDVAGAQRGVIFLKEPGGFLRPACSIGVPDEELEGKAAISTTLVKEVGKSGKPVLVRNASLDESLKDQRSVIELSLKSILCAPVQLLGELIGVFYLDSSALEREFTEEHLKLLIAFAKKVASPLQASRVNQWHAEETRVLQRALDDLRTKYSYDQIVGMSPPMQEMFRVLDKVTPTQFPVLIHGESGTGKELVAKAIHFNGPRKSKAFIAENCAALPETLLESELFGHAKGSFTGADKDKKGLFELATGGTLFLDEVGDMGGEMQKALLRVLQEGEIRPVGGKTSVKVDVRIIAATHRRLDEMVKEGKFRQDLFYRLNVIAIAIPPLRERREDIPYLVHHFLERNAKGTSQPERRIDKEAMEAMCAYDWPGNIRELENEVKRLVAMGEGEIERDQLSTLIRQAVKGPPRERARTRVTRRIAPKMTLDEIEKDAIAQSLKENEFNLRKTARVLGIDRMSLKRRIEKYGIPVPKRKKREEEDND